MTPVFHNDLITILMWVIAIFLCLSMASLWMIYLVKVTINEDEVQEKIRRHKRISEEIVKAHMK